MSINYASDYTVEVHIVKDSQDDAHVIYHLIDEDGNGLLTRIGRESFLEDAELIFNVDASMLLTEGL